MEVTLSSALRDAVHTLAASPASATARRDAELLLLRATGLTRAALLTYPDAPLSPAQQAAFHAAIARRAQAEPVQYILGDQEFFGLPFTVTPAVLIPRPETEHLVEAALALVPRKDQPVHIADVGTGSGILAVTLAHQLPMATVTAIDISTAALAVAAGNAQRHGVADRVRFIEADLLGEPAPQESYELIVSNPPYVADTEILEPQVAGYEPHTALFAGPDGLGIYRRLIPQAAAALRPGGWLLLEIGHGQRTAIAGLLTASRLGQVRFVEDLQGIPRVAIAQREPR